EEKRPAVIVVGEAPQPLVSVADEWLRRLTDDPELRARLVVALDRARARRRSARKASLDRATSLPNRRGLVRALVHEHRRAGREGGPLSLVLIAVEGLEKGAPEQDGRLKAVASILRGTLRADECVGRLGGCEFALIVRGTQDDASRAGARVRALLLRSGMTAHLGIAELQPRERLKSLYRRSSRSLVESMRRGRGRKQSSPRALPAPAERLPQARERRARYGAAERTTDRPPLGPAHTDQA
ncbi:MAG: diguanylate cyclase domain-containing protein, partial [Myxococcales bacterium]